MKKTTNSFPRLTWAEFRKLLNVVVNSMTANPYFPTLQPQVAGLGALADNYYVLDTKASKRDRDVLIARNAARIELTNLLHQIGLVVSSICNGSEEMLSSSGYLFTKTKQKSPPMQKPKPPKLSMGVNSGVIDCKTVSQKGQQSTKFYITAADAKALEVGANANWDVVTTTFTKYTFADLVPGQRYFVKVGMIGVRGQEVVSDATSYISQ